MPVGRKLRIKLLTRLIKDTVWGKNEKKVHFIALGFFPVKVKGYISNILINKHTTWNEFLEQQVTKSKILKT